MGHALATQLNVKSVLVNVAHSGLHFLGEEPDYTPMLISGQAPPVRGFLNRVKNFVMLRAAREVLSRVRRSAHTNLLARAGLPASMSDPYGHTLPLILTETLGVSETPRVQPALASPMVMETGVWLPRSFKPLPPKIAEFLNG